MSLLAASSSGTLLLELAILALWITCMVISGLKGKPGMAVAGLLVGIFPLIGAIRLAKPESYWDRHWYRQQKHEWAVARFAPQEQPEQNTRAGF